ncbi:MAG: glycosyltransferase family 2 protein [Halothiobacillus sp.]|jgi:glycosyltransferase involved in cell wall biosynthesis|nr:glycosyltransferase family 2 protein [Halothiobacillus sp.]
MRISIAMTTYNGAEYLREQLDSFVAQTLLPDELIVCDDLSSDETIEILTQFSQTAPFKVEIVRNEKNLGYIKNFERALSLCTGDIIFLSDQDDVWFSNKIAKMANMMTMQPSIFVLQADMVLTDEKLNPTPFTQLGNILSIGQGADTFISGCGTAIRREWLGIALPIQSELCGHDNWIHRLALALEVRVLLEEPLQFYRRHGENTSQGLASKPQKTTALDSFLAHGFVDATAGWVRELERCKQTQKRILETTEELRKLGLIGRQARAISTLKKRIKALDIRIKNISVNRLRRFPLIIKMWMNGGYHYFAGWKSAVKDILR